MTRMKARDFKLTLSSGGHEESKTTNAILGGLFLLSAVGHDGVEVEVRVTCREKIPTGLMDSWNKVRKGGTNEALGI